MPTSYLGHAPSVIAHAQHRAHDQQHARRAEHDRGQAQRRVRKLPDRVRQRQQRQQPAQLPAQGARVGAEARVGPRLAHANGLACNT